MTKQQPVIAFFLLLSLTACKKSQSAPGNGGNGSPDSTSQNNSSETVVVGKRGSDFNTNNTNGVWSDDIVNLKAHWYYTWGTPLPAQSFTPCEFVPMFWGRDNMTDANISLVQQLKTKKTAKYVLGFNEPNNGAQSNMTVQEVLGFWPKLESIGLPLGSPATDWPTVQWFTDFMDSVASRKLRVDFICVHMYAGLDDVGFVQTLQDLHTKYNLPIWITEFATADWGAASVSANPYKPDQVLAFMQRLLPKLDSLSYVQRYSWFSGDPTSAQLYSSALVDASGKLTALGTWYAGYKPNTSIKKN